MQRLLKVIVLVSSDMSIEFRLNKHTIAHLQKGKWDQEYLEEKLNNEILPEVDKNELYKFEESHQNI